jgi:hypothetical protein
MTEIDGPIRRIHVPNYTEGPWLSKRGGLYYLFYAAFAHQGMSEQICYATAKTITGPWTYRGVLTGSAEGSYTIHPGVAEFKGQSYFFYHNATLTLNGQGGALGRRAVCAEYLSYNADGTVRPVRQTKEGISVPPERQAARNDTAASKPTASDPGVKVTQELGPDPTAWPDRPALRTVADPYDQAPNAMSFNARGRPSRLGQTFRPDADLRLERVLLYAGDGFGATEREPVTVALYDLGDRDAAPEAYDAGTDLLGGGRGRKIAYRPQARGLLQIDFSGAQRVSLKKGHTYAFELQGEAGSAPLFWRRSRRDAHPDGAAYSDGKRLQEREGGSDFAVALYGATP